MDEESSSSRQYITLHSKQVRDDVDDAPSANSLNAGKQAVPVDAIDDKFQELNNEIDNSSSEASPAFERIKSQKFAPVSKRSFYVFMSSPKILNENFFASDTKMAPCNVKSSEASDASDATLSSIKSIQTENQKLQINSSDYDHHGSSKCQCRMRYQSCQYYQPSIASSSSFNSKVKMTGNENFVDSKSQVSVPILDIKDASPALGPIKVTESAILTADENHCHMATVSSPSSSLMNDVRTCGIGCDSGPGTIHVKTLPSLAKVADMPEVHFERFASTVKGPTDRILVDFTRLTVMWTVCLMMMSLPEDVNTKEDGESSNAPSSSTNDQTISEGETSSLVPASLQGPAVEISMENRDLAVAAASSDNVNGWHRNSIVEKVHLEVIRDTPTGESNTKSDINHPNPDESTPDHKLETTDHSQSPKDHSHLKGAVAIKDTRRSGILEALKNYTSEFFFPPPITDSFDFRALKCRISHKVRGGKGEWREIASKDMIRVTKGVGKKVKLVVEAPIPFKASDIQTTLMKHDKSLKDDCTSNVTNKLKNGKFSVESIAISSPDFTGRTCAELLIKLFKLSRSLYFQVVICSKEGGTFKGNTNVFGTHNSGKQPMRYLKRDLEVSSNDETSVPPIGEPKIDIASSIDVGGGGTMMLETIPSADGTQKRIKCHNICGEPADETESTWNMSKAEFETQLPDFSDFCSFSESTQRKIVQKVRYLMAQLGRSLVHEARSRQSSVVVYVICRRNRENLDNFNIYVHGNDGLCNEGSTWIPNIPGRFVFLGMDVYGKFGGVYTVSASFGDFESNLTEFEGSTLPYSGLMVVYDFRHSCIKLKILPAYSIFMPQNSLFGLIGSFYIDPKSFLLQSSIYTDFTGGMTIPHQYPELFLPTPYSPVFLHGVPPATSHGILPGFGHELPSPASAVGVRTSTVIEPTPFNAASFIAQSSYNQMHVRHRSPLQSHPSHIPAYTFAPIVPAGAYPYLPGSSYAQAPPVTGASPISTALNYTLPTPTGIPGIPTSQFSPSHYRFLKSALYLDPTTSTTVGCNVHCPLYFPVDPTYLWTTQARTITPDTTPTPSQQSPPLQPPPPQPPPSPSSLYFDSSPPTENPQYLTFTPSTSESPYHHHHHHHIHPPNNPNNEPF